MSTRFIFSNFILNQIRLDNLICIPEEQKVFLIKCVPNTRKKTLFLDLSKSLNLPASNLMVLL